jgi:hypothetical protein
MNLSPRAEIAEIAALSAWEQWTKEQTFQRTRSRWCRLRRALGPDHRCLAAVRDLRVPHNFIESGETIVSTSTLRFRERDELSTALGAAGFEVVELRDAPDRPGKEFVYIAAPRD